MKNDYRSDHLTQSVIECIIRVHQQLGPGFLESIYRKALLIELRKSGWIAETEKEILIYYEGQEVGCHRLDILVEQTLIVELKTVEDLSKAHYAQVRSYLKACDLQTAILVNFAKEKADFRRIESRIVLNQSIPISPFLHVLLVNEGFGAAFLFNQSLDASFLNEL